MFSNRFNTQNDPLLEAVKGAMQDGDLRRQAVALVNEAFGVYNRSGLVREDLEGYDISVETVYEELKGRQSEIDANHNKKIDADDFKILRSHKKKMEEKKMWEGKKLADKDYDKDGKIESPKDEVWGSRFRAAKKAGKMEEGSMYNGKNPFDPKDPSVQGSGDVSRTSPKEDPSTPKSYPGAASSLTPGNPTSQRMSNAVKENVTAPKEFSQKRFANKGAVTKAPVPGVSIAEEDIDEGMMDKVKGFVKLGPKGMKKTDRIAGKLSDRYGNWDHKKGEFSEKGKEEVKGRLKNVKGASDYALRKEESLDEVSKGAAISAYREKEAQERDTSKLHGLIKRKFGAKTAHHAERAGAQSSVGLVRRGEDRGKEDSIARDRRHPTDRITKSGKVHKQDTATLKGNIKRRLGSHTKPGHLPEETMDEMANSAKTARGKRVAGAVLQRIRAKHMHEDSSF